MPVLCECKDVCAGGFGDIAFMVEHERVGIAFKVGFLFGDGADHVEAGGFGVAGGGLWRRAGIGGVCQADAVHFIVEIVAPTPAGHGDADGGFGGEDAHLFGAAPGERADIGVFEAGFGEGVAFGGLDFGDAIGEVEAEDLGGFFQALGVVLGAVDLARIGPFAFEHGGGIVHAVGEDVDFGLAPGREFAVHPDKSVAVVIGNEAHLVYAFACTLWCILRL